MSFTASVTFDNLKSLHFDLEEYQVQDFLSAVENGSTYQDHKTGVISWLPPDRVYHVIIKPNLESLSSCQTSQSSGLVSDLLT